MSDEEEPTTRVCRRCSTQATTSAAFCGTCGTAFVATRRRPTKRQLVATGLVLVLVAGATGGLLAKRSHDAGVRADAAAAEREAADEAERQAELVQAAADNTEREQRDDIVAALEEQVTKDAKEKVDDDLLEGPIEYTQCTATGGGSTDDLTALTGTFECLAVNEENDDGTLSGYGYRGTAEWDTGDITWQLGT